MTKLIFFKRTKVIMAKEASPETGQNAAKKWAKNGPRNWPKTGGAPFATVAKSMIFHESKASTVFSVKCSQLL